MLTINAIRTEITGTEVLVNIIVTAGPESPGIRYVEVQDRNFASIGHREFDCTPFADFYLDIPRERLPIYVLGAQCELPNSDVPAQGRQVEGPLLNEDRIGREELSPDPRTTCRATVLDMPNRNNAACIDAVSDARRIRNNILLLCQEAAELRNQRNAMSAVAAAALTAAVALAVAATKGGLIGAIILVFAVIALALAIAFGVRTYQLNKAYRAKLHESRAAQGQYADLVSTIQRVCCPEFVDVPLDAPSCE